jgi:hypothetical protein
MGCGCFGRCEEPEIHWLVQLRWNIEGARQARRRGTLRYKLKTWLQKTYYKMFPSMNPLNWMKVVPMKSPTSQIFYTDYTYRGSND